MRRGIGITALMASMALVASACGGGDADDSAGGGDGEIAGTVTFWDTSSDTEKVAYQQIAEDFEKKYPEVDVEYVNVPFGDANAKFKNAAGANSGAPDVMRTEVAWVADFASLGYLAPLDDTAALDDGEQLESALGSTQYDGKTYAVPQVTDTLALFYNKRLLKEAGVDVPESWDALKADAATIEKKTGATPFYLRGDDAYYYLPFLYGEGGDLLDTDAKTVTVDDPEGAQAFAVMKDLVDSGVAITDATDGAENGLTAFQNGKVAMIVDGPWDTAAVMEGAEFKGGDNLGVAPVPAGSGGQGAPQGGWNLSIYAGTENMRAAEEFVKYMGSAEVQKRTVEELSLLPTRTEVYDDPAVQKNEMVQFFGPAVQKAVQRPWIPQANSLFEPIKQQQQGVLFGDTSPEEAATNTGDAFRDLLSDEGYE